jgi:RimJ/RimL family protein N-acetyltransferase
MIETADDRRLCTSRLALRPWTDADAQDAMAIYGDPSVVRWLSPVVPRIADERTMHTILRAWQLRSDEGADPVGHWAVERRADGVLVGGVAIRELETGDGELEIAWQLARAAWGRGYAVEAGRELALWGLAHSGVDELLALVRPRNRRGRATARRIGMEWVGETEKYHGLRLQVYRARSADLVRRAEVSGAATRRLAALERAS